MEYLVLSDSHGKAELIDRALALQVRAPDAVLFLGDGIRDLRVLEYQDICVRPVRGNCDFYTLFEGQSAPEHALIEVGAYRIVMMHGHTHGVKGGMERAVAFAAQAEADVLLYGHTHLPRQEWLDAGISSILKTAASRRVFTSVTGTLLFEGGIMAHSSVCVCFK